MSYIQYDKDQDNLVTLTLDDPDMPVNVMNGAFIDGLDEAVERLEQEAGDISGVIITSGKDTFFAGGDLEEIIAVTPENCEAYFNKVMRIKKAMRRLECLGKPVVSAINGVALGGGYEICLATHHRIALNSRKVLVGLPEVTLGLLPGGGGVIRLVRLLGLQKALPFLTEGTKLSAQDALQSGVVDALAETKEDMLAQAKAWIAANPEAVQPWDAVDFTFPGGSTNNPDIQAFVGAATAKLQASKRDLYPAPKAILCAAVESMQVDFDTANLLEARYLTELAQSSVAKNMITTFFQMNKLNGGESRPNGFAPSKVSKIGILGAGMMGAGIAYAAAKCGIEVVLKDISQEAAEKGKSYSDTVASGLIAKGRMSEEKKQSLLSLIKPTASVEDLHGCELVIEAVFENRELKAQVTKETEAQLADDVIFASNTSTLPITGLATAYSKPNNFIGLHFFSPVDRMKLVEIICGKETSDETLAKAYDFVTQIKKVPIVVNDSRDFYTSRVYESYCDEGAWLLADGVDPALIENAAQQSGMPAGPLASVDAVSQKLVYSVKSQAKKDFEAEGNPFPEASQPPYIWVDRLTNEFDRKGKAFGAGYYEYPKGAKKYLWPELRNLQPSDKPKVPVQDIKDRILFRQCVEALRCLEEGVLRNVIDCNIGSMLGIGFPPYTGGQLQYINTYGLRKFTARAQELADAYGERFTPPQLLLEHAESEKAFV